MTYNCNVGRNAAESRGILQCLWRNAMLMLHAAAADVVVMC